MSKYLFYSDAHAKGNNPSRRIDNYFESWMIKFREMLSLAKKYKVEAIIDGGDLLDGAIVANSVIDEILDAIEDTGIPIYMMWGNHCQIGHHKSTSGGSSLAHMFRRCKLLKDVNEILQPEFNIRFVDYEHNLEEKIKTEGIHFSCHENMWKIAIVHIMITPSYFPTEQHIIAEAVETNANLVIVAHYHEPWTKKVGNTQFLDIGAFGRTSIRGAKNTPSVLLLDTKKRSYEIIPLKSAKPGNQVFDINKKEQEEISNIGLENFISSLKDFKANSLDLRGTVEQISKEQKIERPIVDLIFSKITELEKNELKN